MPFLVKVDSESQLLERKPSLVFWVPLSIFSLVKPNARMVQVQQSTLPSEEVETVEMVQEEEEEESHQTLLLRKKLLVKEILGGESLSKERE